MALGGGKISGATKGRIHSGLQTDGNQFNDRPAKDSGGGGSDGGGGGGAHIYLDMSTGKSTTSQPTAPPPPELMDDYDGPPSAEALQSLGPVEKQRDKTQRRNEGNGVKSDGPLPLHIERGSGGSGGGGGGGDSGSGAGPSRAKSMSARAAYAQSLQSSSTPDSVHQYQRSQIQQQQQAQSAGPNTTTSEINIINHTDVSLKMIAVDTAGSGARVERQLPAKSGDNFLAPIGCTISIIHPVTQKAVFRYKVTDASTTLAVTDAALSGAVSDDELSRRNIGSSGKWYDNRVFMVAAGAGVVCGLLLVAALVAFAVRYLLKQQKLKLAGGGAWPKTASLKF